MMAADRSALLPLGTNVFDMCAFPDSATYYNETFGQYWEGQTTYTPVDLSGSAEVEEIVMRRKEIQEQQRAEEEALEKQRTPQKIEAVDAPLNGLPADLPALFTTIRRLYLEALYTGKWTIFGMMTTLLSCVEAATEFCNASDVISLLSRWTRDWEGMENHHQAIKECLSGERASLSYLEAYYVDQWEVNELILVSKEERRATVIKALKMREKV
ncbi:hypothetical protein BDF14DRAFT_376643 [Spinellus fusiger]|nr:hypothetical protein BDF14DRAFT_376643 [Spinellus fusiger]